MLQGSSLGQFYKQYLEPIKLNDVLVSWETSDLWHHLQILSALEDAQSFVPLHVCVMLLSHHVADRCQPKAHEIEMCLFSLLLQVDWVSKDLSFLREVCHFSLTRLSLWNELVAASMSILLTLLIRFVSSVLSNIMTEASHCFKKCNRNSGCRYLYICLLENLGWLLYTYLHHPLWGADEVSV